MNTNQYRGAYSRRRYSNYPSTGGFETPPTQYTLKASSADINMGDVVVTENTVGQSVTSRSTTVNYIVEARPKPGYMFSHWTGDTPGGKNTANPLYISLTKNVTLVGNFKKSVVNRTVKLTWNKSQGRVNGSLEGSAEMTALDGSTVDIEATPLSGYRFVKWVGGPVDGSTEKKVSFKANGNYTITAIFESEKTGGNNNTSDDEQPGSDGRTITGKAIAFVKQWWWALLIAAYLCYKEMKGGRK